MLGQSYAAAGEMPFRIVVIAVVPMTVMEVYCAVCRGLHRLGEAIAVALASAVVSLAATVVVAPRYGLVGIAAAWLGFSGDGLWAGLRLARLLPPFHPPQLSAHFAVAMSGRPTVDRPTDTPALMAGDPAWDRSWSLGAGPGPRRRAPPDQSSPGTPTGPSSGRGPRPTHRKCRIQPWPRSWCRPGCSPSRPSGDRVVDAVCAAVDHEIVEDTEPLDGATVVS